MSTTLANPSAKKVTHEPIAPVRRPPRRAPVKVTCIVPTFNAGDTTRGVEICRAFVDAGRERGREVDVAFVFPRTERSYESQITGAGFATRPLDCELVEETITSITTANREGDELVSHRPTARRYIRVFLDEMTARRPDIVFFGFVPPAGIAAQMMGVPSVAFLPLPAHWPWVRRHLLKDVPDQLENAFTARLPPPARRALAGLLSRSVTVKRFFTQPTLSAAARELGWHPAGGGLFAMLAASVQLVNDLPGYYRNEDVGPRTKITGPLFCRPTDGDVDPRIREMLAPGRTNRVFVSMGSSGEKPYLLEAIATVAAMQVRAVVLVPPRICSLAEVQSRLRVPAHVHLTDAFVPAHQVNAMADAAVIHGGQGTVQTAIHAGTPIVGVGMHVEQSTNLDHVAHRGAGIRIARGDWTAERIRHALQRILDEPSYRRSALRLKAEQDAIDGRREAGLAMWALVDAQRL